MSPREPPQLVKDPQYLQTLGANFVRGGHYPQDQRWLDLCDETGILVFEEGVGWSQKEHLTQMVDSSYNHQSVMLIPWAWTRPPS
ncbi:MAG: hypothetical protein GW949_00245 [Spirochaetales bacterium]|nr:hypothetical protein [Spirochaetales bacterium]